MPSSSVSRRREVPFLVRPSPSSSSSAASRCATAAACCVEGAASPRMRLDCRDGTSSSGAGCRRAGRRGTAWGVSEEQVAGARRAAVRVHQQPMQWGSMGGAAGAPTSLATRRFLRGCASAPASSVTPGPCAVLISALEASMSPSCASLALFLQGAAPGVAGAACLPAPAPATHAAASAPLERTHSAIFAARSRSYSFSSAILGLPRCGECGAGDQGAMGADQNPRLATAPRGACSGAFDTLGAEI